MLSCDVTYMGTNSCRHKSAIIERSGNVWDNAAMESFFSSLKKCVGFRDDYGR